MKRLLTLIVALCMVLVGCSSGGGDTASNTQEQSSEAVSSEQESTEESHEDKQYFDEYGNEIDYEYSWVDTDLSAKLPKPDEKYVVTDVYTDEKEYNFKMYGDLDKTYFNEYMEACKESGFKNVTAFDSDGSYEATNDEGWQLSLDFDDAEDSNRRQYNTMSVSLYIPPDKQ